MNTRAKRLLRALCAGTLLMTLAESGRAQAAAVSQWTNDGGGIFESPSNWDNGVPGGTDTAVFQRGNVSYTVQFNTDVATDKLRVGTNTVTFQPVGDSGS